MPPPYRPRSYAHLVLLHAGLLVRIVGGDLLGNQALWQTGGVLNVIALLLFVGSSAGAVVQGLSLRRGARPRPERRPAHTLQREIVRID